MLVEISSSLVAGGVLAFAHANKNMAFNDAQKIQRIFSNSNMNVKEDGKQKSIRLFKRRKIEG